MRGSRSYDNDISLDQRKKVPLREQKIALANIKAEVELGFDPPCLAMPRRSAA